MEKLPLYLEEDIRPEMKDDIYDPTYQDKEGPRPQLEYVWRNIILMSMLHLGAVYGIFLIPYCKLYTCLWGKRHLGPAPMGHSCSFAACLSGIPKGMVGSRLDG